MLRHEAADVLQVPAQATQDEIRRAYLAAARRAHPDLGGSASEFKRVAAAYAALSSRGGLTFPPSSSAYSHYHRASSAAYSSSAASLRPPRASFSNVTLALVLSVPLALAGVAAAHANAHGGVARGARPEGVLSPAVNIFLREDRHARVAPSRLMPTLKELWGGGGGGRGGVWQWGR